MRRLTKIDFMGKRKIAAVISIALVILSLADLLFQGLNLGLDFTGGTLLEVEFAEPASPVEVRRMLEQRGFEDGVVQYFGSERELLVRMPPQGLATAQDDEGAAILDAIQDTYPDAKLLQSSFVGPAVGEELTEQAGLALLVAAGGILLYVMFRYTKHFAVGAVVALVHDVIIVLGLFSLFGWTFDLTVLAALLAVIGYSVNDTIVIFDRIRENFRTIRRTSVDDMINISINQTLDRTLITSGTTLMVVLALLFAGGEMIRGFAGALAIGIVVGTYSSVFVSVNVLKLMNVQREDLLIPEKEEAEPDRP